MVVTSMTASYQFALAGFAVIPDVIDDSLCTEVSCSIEAMNVAGAGSRRLLEQPWSAAVVARFRMHAGLNVLLPEGAVAVQCTLFSKSAERNWLRRTRQSDRRRAVILYVCSPNR